MNPSHHHKPIPPDPTRARCPVCHEAVYSRAGIHPQCALRLADPPRPKPGTRGPVAATAAVAGPTKPA